MAYSLPFGLGVRFLCFICSNGKRREVCFTDFHCERAGVAGRCCFNAWQHVAATLCNELFRASVCCALNQFLSPKIRVQPIINKSCCVLQCNFPIFASCCFAVFINYLKCKTFKNSEIKFINIAAVEQKTSKHFYIFTIIELGAEFSLCLTHFTQ